MKMNINKACDLNSISVFPPNLRRRSSVGPADPQASQQLSSQQSRQLRSQQSQQSFSQGPSSQRGVFSQMSQSSLEDALGNDQRFSSQERDLNLNKVSCLPPINHRREDSQLVVPRSSSNLTRRWNSASIAESKLGQIGEELEQRFGVIETSLSRYGMMLDSIQSDIMQANRGTKEVYLESERINQKLILQDTSLQQLRKEQADIKVSLDEGVKSILEQLNKDPYEEKLQKILLMLTTIPEQVETALLKIQREICHTITKEFQVVASLKMPDPNAQIPTVPKGLVDKVHTRANHVETNTFRNTTTSNTKQLQLPANPYNTSSRTVRTLSSPKIQVGCWKTVKPEQMLLKRRSTKKQVKLENSNVQQSKQYSISTVVIDSDEDIERGFSCLLDGNTNGVLNVGWDAKKETEKILRTARRTKRKFGNPIIIN